MLFNGTGLSHRQVREHLLRQLLIQHINSALPMITCTSGCGHFLLRQPDQLRVLLYLQPGSGGWKFRSDGRSYQAAIPLPAKDPKQKYVSLTVHPRWTIRYRRSYSGRRKRLPSRISRSSPIFFDAPETETYTLLSVSDINYPSGTGTVIRLCCH